MIAQEKDRLECLKLAVTLFIPKQVAPEKLAAQVVLAAEMFHSFVSGTQVVGQERDET
ncbi:hypothetical protein [Bradyrhizobium prioriisuperbiae]|uniref:hypothetical protein n=1 Tax=Bradyrhizobium prioriisuperbiae TaxID=2854389 RepID=UPI0028E6698B|nr:hypothetical protein [Bradyrhizobium prioritasuperba]